jgi:hypothetical protein
MYAERQGNGSIKPMPTPDQVEEAKNFMRNQMRQMIDKKLEMKPYTDQAQYAPQPSAAQIAVGLDAQKAKSFGNIIRNFWESGGANKEALRNALISQTGVRDIVINQSGNEVTATIYKDDKVSNPIPLTDKNGNPVDILNFGRTFGGWVYGNDILTTYLKDFEGTLRGGVYNPDYATETLNSGKVAELQNKIAAKNKAIEESKLNFDLNRITVLVDELGLLQKQLDALGGASATNLNATKKKQGG